MAALGNPPRIVDVGGTTDGAVALTTMSQEQVDHLAAQSGFIAWEASGRYLTAATYGQARGGIVALARFDCANRKHRLALRDVLTRGTLHIAAAESLSNGAIDAMKIALDVRPADGWIIERALRDRP